MLNLKLEQRKALGVFEPSELNDLVGDLKKSLTNSAYNQIQYLVIQSGTSLSSTSNTGSYDRERLKSMIKVANDYNLKSKEHNGGLYS